MSLQTVTVQLPDPLYQQVKHRASQMHRSVEDELIAIVTAALPTIDDLPADVANEIKQLAFLTDDELWQAARTTLPINASEQMQELVEKRQREGLTLEEEAEIEQLAHRYDRTMLVRAQAAALLKERGHDVSSLKQVISG
jgi:plasmid stability protein